MTMDEFTMVDAIFAATWACIGIICFTALYEYLMGED